MWFDPAVYFPRVSSSGLERKHTFRNMLRTWGGPPAARTGFTMFSGSSRIQALFSFTANCHNVSGRFHSFNEPFSVQNVWRSLPKSNARNRWGKIWPSTGSVLKPNQMEYPVLFTRRVSNTFDQHCCSVWRSWSHFRLARLSQTHKLHCLMSTQGLYFYFHCAHGLGTVDLHVLNRHPPLRRWCILEWIGLWLAPVFIWFLNIAVYLPHLAPKRRIRAAYSVPCTYSGFQYRCSTLDVRRGPPSTRRWFTYVRGPFTQSLGVVVALPKTLITLFRSTQLSKYPIYCEVGLEIVWINNVCRRRDDWADYASP